MSKLDQLIEKIKAGEVEFKAPQKSVAPVKPKNTTTKAKAEVKVTNAIPEKDFEEVREMFHFLMFQNRMKQSERAMIGPMYNKFCETERLSPAQRSFVAAIWINYQPKDCCGE